jgi:transcription elongation factor GreA
MMMNEKKVPVTEEGLQQLQAELEELRDVRRPTLAEQVAEARSHGDLRENSAYDAARHDQMMNERRIADLEALLRNAVIVDKDAATTGNRVGLGATVVVEFEGEEERYTIVGAIEAKPSQGKISNESPIGRALLGKRPGDVATVGTPGGNRQLKVIRIET